MASVFSSTIFRKFRASSPYILSACSRVFCSRSRESFRSALQRRIMTTATAPPTPVLRNGRTSATPCTQISPSFVLKFMPPAALPVQNDPAARNLDDHLPRDLPPRLRWLEFHPLGGDGGNWCRSSCRYLLAILLDERRSRHRLDRSTGVDACWPLHLIERCHRQGNAPSIVRLPGMIVTGARLLSGERLRIWSIAPGH